ncbi:choline ABC transporter substrate-binding protein [Dongia sp.]|uniref:choline ABC transporter substrate-binding protein n=1 Tax=Dongia sp. TaxID=1977262 RepID=UPI0035ADCB16
MRASPLLLSACVLIVAPSLALAAEPESCRNVRLAEPGWNDLTFTTGVTTTILNALGYKAESNLLGLDIIYQSLKNKDLDVFMGYWDPAMVSYYQAYKDDGSVETVHRNLEGAKYTFAVPQYVYDAGVHDIADLAAHADKFEAKMYGIEPGSNQLMFDIVADAKFKLDGWEVVESSEQGMLTQVDKAVRRKDWILFQGWAPHPMNNDFPLAYLTGGDAYYGPDLGAATVHTQVRKGYMAECPNVAMLLKNITFDIPLENEGMGYLIRESLGATDAAAKALKAHPAYLDAWLAGVTTIDGGEGLAAVKKSLGL